MIPSRGETSQQPAPPPRRGVGSSPLCRGHRLGHGRPSVGQMSRTANQLPIAPPPRICVHAHAGLERHHLGSAGGSVTSLLSSSAAREVGSSAGGRPAARRTGRSDWRCASSPPESGELRHQTESAVTNRLTGSCMLTAGWQPGISIQLSQPTAQGQVQSPDGICSVLPLCQLERTVRLLLSKPGRSVAAFPVSCHSGPLLDVPMSLLCF